MTKGTLYQSISKIVGSDLLMLFGDTGSGKSKITYAVARETKEAGGKVIFLDTERNLSAREVAALGDAYAYTPVFEEIKGRIGKLPAAELVVLDSIGLPILIHYSRMNLRDRLHAFLDMAAALGDLKDWTYRHNGLAIVTNQPVSEFMAEEERKRLTRVWGNGDAREPFGGKAKHVAKEIWRTQRISGNLESTRIVVSAFRSRELASGVIIAEGVINNEGLKLDFKFAPTISEETIADLLAGIEGAGSLGELETIGEKITTITMAAGQRSRLREAYRKRRGQLKASGPGWEEPSEVPEEPATAQERIEQAQKHLQELLAEADAQQTVQKETPAIEEHQPTMEDVDELWPYAKAKGIPDGIVHQVLEQTGGAVEETLAHLKKIYGE
jgi:RecA/RadA recombinase